MSKPSRNAQRALAVGHLAARLLSPPSGQGLLLWGRTMVAVGVRASDLFTHVPGFKCSGDSNNMVYLSCVILVSLALCGPLYSLLV